MSKTRENVFLEISGLYFKRGTIIIKRISKILGSHVVLAGFCLVDRKLTLKKKNRQSFCPEEVEKIRREYRKQDITLKLFNVD